MFEWAGRPVSFDPPPSDWRHGGYNQGGWLGVHFVRERFDTYDERALRSALQQSRYRTDDPLSPQEADVAHLLW